jgi:multiple sugar transport system ATP-binding protein
MARVVIDGVSKRYGSVMALDNVCLDISSGSFTSIFGPPSSGKTVLLRLLLGLETVDEGRILLDDQDVTHVQPHARNLSMVFQNLALFPHLSARQNICFPLVRQGAAKELIDSRLERVSAVLGIAHILDKRPATLSGGERQRVAIARALIRDASAYLMDEPIAALDARLRDVMRVELKRLQTEFGHTFVYVTHDHEEAMSVADQLAILEHGRVVQFGDPGAIYEEPKSLYVAELIGAPRINVLRGALTRGDFVGPHGSLALKAGDGLGNGSASINCAAAIRPEAISLSVAVGPSALPGAIEDIELLGGYAVATVSVKEARLRVIIKATNEWRAGQTVGVAIAASDVMLFDDSTGLRLHRDAKGSKP